MTNNNWRLTFVFWNLFPAMDATWSNTPRQNVPIVSSGYDMS